MMHWECTVPSCALHDDALRRRRIDCPLPASFGVECDKCWRLLHHLPVAPTTSADLEAYVDDANAEPSFMPELRRQQRTLAELPPAA